MSNENKILMCAECGSDRIEEQVWSHVNRGRIHNDQEIDAGPLSIVNEGETYYWCPECQEHITDEEGVRWSDQEYCPECQLWYEANEMHPVEAMCKYCAEEQ